MDHVVFPRWMITLGCLVTAWFLTGCVPHAEDSTGLGAGFRFSAYGPAYDPGPEYWVRVGEEMAGHFDGAAPETLWIVGRLDGDGVRLNFRYDKAHDLIKGSKIDENEKALSLFDEHGVRVWLQVEPGHAPVEDLIEIVMDRYGHHPCVIGFGVDVEWYESTTHPDGTPVSDEVAASWLAAIREYDPGFRLFLKHWEPEKMPPTLREGLLFVDDSQILPSMDAMVAEFAEWGRAFAPAPVGFQFGYAADRPWWRRLENPPHDLGQAILDSVPNTAGLYWVDFTVLDVFPPDEDWPAASPASVGYDPAPRPIAGIKIYEHTGELEPLFGEWRELGVNTVFAGADLANRDGFMETAAASDTDVFIIFPVLFAPEELQAKPDFFAITADGEPARDDWLEFACPSKSSIRRQRMSEAVELVSRLRPTGLSLDFVRHFAFWEMIEPDTDPDSIPETCYCPTCLRRFAEILGGESEIQINDPVAAADWIRTNAADEWVRFKTDTISSLVWEIVEAVRAHKPSIRINLHTVPWRSDDFDRAITRIAAQDRETLGGYSDYLSPMCYSFMLYQNPAWISSVVHDTAMVGQCPVLPSIQVQPYYRGEDTFGVKDFEAALRAALEPPSAGVVLWSWEQLEADAERREIVRKVLPAR